MAKQATQNSTQLTASTLSYLGLSQQPYADNLLQLEAIYSDATRDQLVNTLKHHMQFSDLLLVIEGAHGSGKTTLYRQLLQEKHANLFLMPALVEATDTLTQIQLKMSEQLKGQGTANYLDDNLKNLHIFDQIPVLIIDDAHVLSDTTLQELIRYRSQLKQEKDVPLKILLLGNPGLARTLETISDLQHNQMYVQQMPELTPKQIQAFIEHRLAQAKYKGGLIFDPDTLLSIHKKSNGNPGHVLRLAALLTEKYVMKQTREGKSPLKLLGYSTATLALAAVIYFGWQQFSSAPSTPVTPPPVEPAATDTALIDMPPVTEQAVAPASDGPIIDESPAPEVVDTETAPTAASTGREASLPPAAVEAPAEMINPAPVSPAPAHAAKPESTPALAPALAPATKPEKSTPAPTPAAVAAKPENPASPVASTPAPTPEKAAAAPAAPATPGADKTYMNELAAMGIKDAAWLKTQPASHWTLQVLGARDLKTLVKFARANKLGDDSAWYETRTHGKPWYVLVHRFYTDADIARKTLERLPPELQHTQPWVKSLASIHKDLLK